MKHKTLLLFAVMTAAGCTSGCTATLRSDGMLHANYWLPTAVVVETAPVLPAAFVPAPVLLPAPPTHERVVRVPAVHPRRPVYRPSPAPRPLAALHHKASRPIRHYP